MVRRVADDSLSQLLGVQKHLLQLLAVQPHLKQVQKRLNTYLQSVYYLRRTPAAYGFQIAVDGDNDTRNILTNARRHLPNGWMLTADFQDFFHQITYDLEIGKLRHLMEIHYRSGRPTTQWLEQYQQQIEGQMTFAQFVLTETDSQLRELQMAYQSALQTMDTCEPVSWINSAYL